MSPAMTKRQTSFCSVRQMLIRSANCARLERSSIESASATWYCLLPVHPLRRSFPLQAAGPPIGPGERTRHGQSKCLWPCSMKNREPTRYVSSFSCCSDLTRLTLGLVTRPASLSTISTSQLKSAHNRRSSAAEVISFLASRRVVSDDAVRRFRGARVAFAVAAEVEAE